MITIQVSHGKTPYSLRHYQ